MAFNVIGPMANPEAGVGTIEFPRVTPRIYVGPLMVSGIPTPQPGTQTPASTATDMSALSTQAQNFFDGLSGTGKLIVIALVIWIASRIL